MSREHADTEALVDLGTALGWRTEALEHIWGCDACKSQLDELGALHRRLAPGRPLDRHVVGGLFGGLGKSEQKPQEVRSYDWAARVLTPLLAAAAAVLVGLLSGG